MQQHDSSTASLLRDVTVLSHDSAGDRAGPYAAAALHVASPAADDCAQRPTRLLALHRWVVTHTSGQNKSAKSLFNAAPNTLLQQHLLQLHSTTRAPGPHLPTRAQAHHNCSSTMLAGTVNHSFPQHPLSKTETQCVGLQGRVVVRHRLCAAGSLHLCCDSPPGEADSGPCACAGDHTHTQRHQPGGQWR